MAIKKSEWIIIYDIRDHRRLGRVHRNCKKWAMPLQRSVFITVLSERELNDKIDGLESLIDPTEDDIRIYGITDLESDIIYGTSRLPLMLEQAIKQKNKIQID